MEDTNDETTIRIQKKGRRNLDWVLTVQGRKKMTPFSHEFLLEVSKWRGMEMDTRPKTESSIAVTESCLCVEEHCLVEEYRSRKHAGGP